MIEHGDLIVQDLHLAFRDGDPEAEHKTAEAENVRCLGEEYAAIVRGDFTGAGELLAEDVELEIVGPADMPMTGRWRGRAEVAEALRSNFSQVGDLAPEIQSVTAQGDTVVVVGRDHGIFRPTGRPYDVHWVQLFTFRDGRQPKPPRLHAPTAYRAPGASVIRARRTRPHLPAPDLSCRPKPRSTTAPTSPSTRSPSAGRS